MHVKKYTNIPSPVRRVHAGAISALVVLIAWASVATPLSALAATAPVADECDATAVRTEAGLKIPFDPGGQRLRLVA